MSPEAVAGFMLFNTSFPRSFAICLDEIDNNLGKLRSHYGLRAGAGAMELLDETRAALDSYTPQSVVAFGLHQFVDYLQRQLIAVNAEIRRDFCGVLPVETA